MSQSRETIVAVGLLTSGDLAALGQGFRRVYMLTDDTNFSDLLQAIDNADALDRRGRTLNIQAPE